MSAGDAPKVARVLKRSINTDTAAQIAMVINAQLGVDYHPRYIGRLLQRLGIEAPRFRPDLAVAPERSARLHRKRKPKKLPDSEMKSLNWLLSRMPANSTNKAIAQLINDRFERVHYTPRQIPQLLARMRSLGIQPRIGVRPTEQNGRA